MIKNILEDDDDNLKKDKSKPDFVDERKKIVEDSEENVEVLRDISKSEINTQNNVVSEEEIKTEDEIETIEEIKTAIETGNIPPKNSKSIKPFEDRRPIGQPQYERMIEENSLDSSSSVSEETFTKSERELELEKKLAEIEAELLAEKETHDKISEAEKIQNLQRENLKVKQNQNREELENLVRKSVDLPSEKDSESAEIGTYDFGKINVSHEDFKPESKAETFRKSGLAWSAAIALFGSIVFMMILGWFADTLLDSSPWGITVGIILGAVIGFLQFFRMTSQITNPKPNDFEKVSLHTGLQETNLENDLLKTKKDEIKPK